MSRFAGVGDRVVWFADPYEVGTILGFWYSSGAAHAQVTWDNWPWKECVYLHDEYFLDRPLLELLY